MKLRYALVVCVLFMVAILVNVIGYERSNGRPVKGSNSIEVVPLRFAEWQGEEVQLNELVFDILETKSIIHRSYSSASGEHVFLSLVYYPETNVDFHAPESCLAGKGIQLMKSGKTVLLRQAGEDCRLQVNRLLRKEGEQSSLVYYFFKAGDFLGRDYFRLRINLVLNKFLSDNRSGALIRVSTPISPGLGGEEKAAITLHNFLEALYPYIARL